MGRRERGRIISPAGEPLLDAHATTTGQKWVLFVEGLLVASIVAAIVTYLLYYPQTGQTRRAAAPTAQAQTTTSKRDDASANNSAQTATPGTIHTLAEAQRYVRFKLTQPSYIPDGMQVGSVKVEQLPQSGKSAVTLMYTPNQSVLQLLLTESDAPISEPSDQREVEPFRVTGQIGRLIIDTAGIPHAFWERDGVYFRFEPTGLNYAPVNSDNSLLDEMRKVIESLPPE